MKVTNTLRTTLINSALEDVNKARAVLKDAEAVLKWAQSLSVGAEFQAPNTTSNTSYSIEKRYYVASRSGRSQGHYIVVDSYGNVDCSCPGFRNRGYCWATSKPGNYVFNVWMKSASVFDSNRRLAINN